MPHFPNSTVNSQRLIDRTIGSEDIASVVAAKAGSIVERMAWLESVQYLVPSLLAKIPSAGNLTISGATTWNDAAGYKRVGTLTINAGQVLRIERSPFMIICDELVWGSTSSQINGDGPDGASSSPGLSYYFAQGGRCTDGSAVAQGGYGGAGLIIIAGRVSGAAGKITVNGGDAFANGTAPTTNNVASAGRGALDIRWAANSSGTAKVGAATITVAANALAGHLTAVLGPGGGAAGGSGGGSGGETAIGGSVARAGGGSGVGGGGGAGSDQSSAGNQAMFGVRPLTVDTLLMLYALGCAGGGGGGAEVQGTGNNSAGGGAGGYVGLVTPDLAVTPTLEYAGGAGAQQGAAVGSAGADGFGTIVVVNG